MVVISPSRLTTSPYWHFSAIHELYHPKCQVVFNVGAFYYHPTSTPSWVEQVSNMLLLVLWVAYHYLKHQHPPHPHLTGTGTGGVLGVTGPPLEFWTTILFTNERPTAYSTAAKSIQYFDRTLIQERSMWILHNCFAPYCLKSVAEFMFGWLRIGFWMVAERFKRLTFYFRL